MVYMKTLENGEKRSSICLCLHCTTGVAWFSGQASKLQRLEKGKVGLTPAGQGWAGAGPLAGFALPNWSLVMNPGSSTHV